MSSDSEPERRDNLSFSPNQIPCKSQRSQGESLGTGVNPVPTFRKGINDYVLLEREVGLRSVRL